MVPAVIYIYIYMAFLPKHSALTSRRFPQIISRKELENVRRVLLESDLIVTFLFILRNLENIRYVSTITLIYNAAETTENDK